MTKTSSELALLDATAQAALVREGELTAAELTQAAIERMERINPQLNAIIHPDPQGAMARAANVSGGPLCGVPIAMKDIGGDEAGRPNQAGMRALKEADYRPAEDSYFTGKMKAAGTVSIGRTNTPELALLPTTEPVSHGATHNPWKLGYSAGGSSGGAASAVAAGIVPVAHASDGGGSIRGPASMCGLVGLKPSRGRCSFGPGLGERWNGFSNELVVSRTVRDTAAFLDALHGPMPGDPYSAPPPTKSYVDAMGETPRALRIGLLDQGTRAVEIDPEAATAARNTAKALEQLGHHVEQAYPEALDDASHVGHYVSVVQANTARALDLYGEKLGRTLGQDDVEPLTWALAQGGRTITAPQFVEVLQGVHGFGRKLAGFFGDYDLLVTPTQGKAPPEHGYFTSSPEEPLMAFILAAPYGVFTLPYNMSGQPGISLPCHWTPDGLPQGVQLVSGFGREDLLLQVARQLEEAMPWVDRRPPVFA